MLDDGSFSGECPCGDWRFAVFNIHETANYLVFRAFLKESAECGSSITRVHAPEWVCEDTKEWLGVIPTWTFVATAAEEETAAVFEPQPSTAWKRLLDEPSAV